MQDSVAFDQHSQENAVSFELYQQGKSQRLFLPKRHEHLKPGQFNNLSKWLMCRSKYTGA